MPCAAAFAAMAAMLASRASRSRTRAGVVISSRLPGRAILVSVIDNLMKGAAGQAVQNFNLVFGLDETAGLEHAPMFP